MNKQNAPPVTPEISLDAAQADKKDFLVVGLGASAGGIGALKEFFAAMPADSGMAFVVILHLSPNHESNLDAILQHQTMMPVVQVTETMKVRPNEVYVIPPNKNLAMADGVITLTEPERDRGTRVAIDLFFRTLADAYGRNGVCVILSGTGSDGTLGLKRVKESNGFAVVQSPEDAEYDGMPRSAIATNLADWILPVKEMPEKLVSLRASSERMNLTSGSPKAAVEIKGAEDLNEVLTILRVRTGHDFSNYKQPTLLRRIARHLQIHELEDVSAYLKLLRDRPEEIQSLLKNLLINVTNFFRDKEAFEALEKIVIPKLFAGKTSADAVRVWIPACASGEEAYSLAMILSEYAAQLQNPPKLQIFASDMDDQATAEARRHRYPLTIEADVSLERLRKFFTKEGDFYTIKKNLRELILFAAHNVLSDPPFSHLDLISCRNLLIYLNREAQHAALQIFHFALKPEGFLFLGNSESADGDVNLFAPLDKKHRIYTNRQTVVAPTAPFLPLPMHPNRWQVRGEKQASSESSFAPELRFSFGEAHYRIMEQLAPPSILVNDEFEVVHLSESAGRFLRLPGGDRTSDLFKLIHPDLLPDLRAAVFTAQRDGKTSEFQNIRVDKDGKTIRVNLTVQQVQISDGDEREFLLVVFEENQHHDFDVSPAPDLEAKTETQTIAGDAAAETVIRRLEKDLRGTKDRLRLVIEQSDTQTEELKSGNEELQTINEELRSTTEELETGKEELQSVNEELIMINHEYKEKIDEISRVNSDLQNFLAVTDIGTIFLDRDLCIKRFTPSVERIFNIIPGDVGRPLAHLSHHLVYENLMSDAGDVLRTLKAFEREIRDREGRCHLARIVPYRTSDDRIEGVVLTFVDTTELRRANENLRGSEERLRLLVQSTVDYAIISLDENGLIDLWNAGAEHLFGYSVSEITGKNVAILFTAEDRAAGVPAGKLDRARETGSAANERWHVRQDGSEFFGSGVMTRLEGGKHSGFAKIVRDLTEGKRAENDLRESNARLEQQTRVFDTTLSSIVDFAYTFDREGRFTFVNKPLLDLWGLKLEDALGKNFYELNYPDELAAHLLKQVRQVFDTGQAVRDETAYTSPTGAGGYYEYIFNPVFAADGTVEVIAGSTRDVTSRRQKETELQDIALHKDEFLATLAHELRNPLAPILSGLEIVRRASGDKQARLNALAIIERQTKQIIHLVDDLLDVSRITQGKIKLKKERIELKTAIEMALETSKPLIEAGKHALEVALPDKPIYVDADMTRISQVVLNILNNSAKYTEPGGTINLTASIENGDAIIKIKDTGIGIPLAMLSDIFQMYTQIGSTAEQSRAGLGIGLSVARRLAEMHGGTVTASSAGAGTGSEFVLKLPLAAEPKPTKESEKNNEKVIENTKPVHVPRKILVVDDNRDAAKLLEVLFLMEKHRVRTAFDGETAIEIALEFAPEVCILDIGLPGMDGCELARRLREKLPKALLIALSGWGQDEDRRRTREVGFDFHFVKPMDIDEIIKLLQ